MDLSTGNLGRDGEEVEDTKDTAQANGRHLGREEEERAFSDHGAVSYSPPLLLTPSFPQLPTLGIIPE